MDQRMLGLEEVLGLLISYYDIYFHFEIRIVWVKFLKKKSCSLYLRISVYIYL